MTRAEWDKMEKVPGKRFRFQTGTYKGTRTGTAISYFKYSVRLQIKEPNNKWNYAADSDEQFSCEQVEEVD